MPRENEIGMNVGERAFNLAITTKQVAFDSNLLSFMGLYKNGNPPINFFG